MLGHAVPELERRGWPVIGGHDDNGLAQAIETRVLGTQLSSHLKLDDLLCWI